MKYLLFILSSVFFLTLMPQTADAQMRNFLQETFTADTATNAETLTFTPSKYLDELCSYSWVIYFDRLSGTASATVILQESAGTSGSMWIDKDTVTITNSTTDAYYEFTGAELLNSRQRVKLTTSGTQSSLWSVQAVWKRRED